MKIDLKYPYSEKWKFGYIVTNSENRKTLILYNNCGDRTSTQYARYLLAIKLKRFLTEEEIVDHIDGDKTNDSLNNLQILSREDNIRKACKKPDIKLICPICGTVFYKQSSKLSGKKLRERVKNNLICCSRKCGRISASRKLKKNKGD